MLKDRDGVPVQVGMKVLVVSVGNDILESLNSPEKEEILSMIGDKLEIIEIDEQGFGWVQKFWQDGANQTHSQMIGLASNDMQVVESAN